MKNIIQLLTLFWIIMPAMAQEDPVLMTIEGNPVKLSEFSYIYEKNNGQSADYSEESVKEYLELFTNFKLKVYKAKAMGMDTLTALQRELAGYRKQLANSYLMDRELSERLIREMYDRRAQDVRISHILFKTRQKVNNTNLAKALVKAKNVRKAISEGQKFEDLVAVNSDDYSSVKKGGDIGYITSWLPSGFYDLENAAYNLKIGEISDPIISKLGVHLIQVTDRRPAYGKIEVAHILVRHDSKSTEDPEGKIKKIHDMLEKGQPFDRLAQTLSEDKSSAGQGGRLKPFGINTFETNFEKAAFALQKDGEYSQPVKTRIGWHIIKRLSKPSENYEDFKARMKPQLPKLERYEKIKDILVAEVKEEYAFDENQKALHTFIGKLDDQFFSYRWKIPESIGDEVLFSFGKAEKKTTADFAQYLKNDSRGRMRYSNEKPVAEAVKIIYDQYVKEIALDLEEKNLEKKYPDFAALMREYEEGILLFEVSKLMVWDKASQDTVGLLKFFEKNKKNYFHDPKAFISEYTVPTRNRSLVREIYEYAKNHPASEVLAKYNSENEVIIVEQNKFDRTNEKMKYMKWQKGAASSISLTKNSNTSTFLIIEDIIPAKQKSLDESRGYVIADYQQQLEKMWVQSLKKEYHVEYNNEVLDNLIKS